MMQVTEKILDTLINNISSIPKVQSIGISGKKAPLPQAGEGDIDIFIYCNAIPDISDRQNIIDQLDDQVKDGKVNVFEGGHWGTGDFVLINGIETWLMYFTLKDTLIDVEAILNGEYPDKLDNYYYPIGRCAMLKNINVLYDKSDFLYKLKSRLSEYPDKLAKILVEYHLEELEDTEDLERAVTRGDVLFYHFAMDIAMDHFLQTLFAINRSYFPSRKRTLEYINGFNIKPDSCNERLLEAVKLGSYSEGINQSYIIWCDLVNELKSIGEN